MDATRVVGALLAPDPFRPGTSRWLSLLGQLLGPGSAIVAAVLFVWTAATMHEYPSLYDNLALLFATIVGSLVVIARFRPVLAFVAALVFSTLVQSAGGMGIGSDIPLLLCAVTAIGFARVRGWTLAVVLSITAMVLPTALHYVYNGQDTQLTRLTWAAVLVLVLTVDALLVWRKFRTQDARLARVRHDAEAEREQRRYLEERNRIAREMHDVVAHHMSVVAVKASTAEYRHGDISGDLRDEFRAIADTARESLSEMRQVLAVFRPEDGSAEREPQPGVEKIGQLCQGAIDAGVDVTVTISENLPELPDTVSLTAYRIVQEALSNVVRHAPGATATVELSREGDWLVIVVLNGAATKAESPGFDVSGLGLAGMRERVDLLAGDLFAEPLGRSAFLVRARLPLDPTPERADQPIGEVVAPGLGRAGRG